MALESRIIDRIHGLDSWKTPIRSSHCLSPLWRHAYLEFVRWIRHNTTLKQPRELEWQLLLDACVVVCPSAPKLDLFMRVVADLPSICLELAYLSRPWRRKKGNSKHSELQWVQSRYNETNSLRDIARVSVGPKWSKVSSIRNWVLESWYHAGLEVSTSSLSSFFKEVFQKVDKAGSLRLSQFIEPSPLAFCSPRRTFGQIARQGYGWSILHLKMGMPNLSKWSWLSKSF